MTASQSLSDDDVSLLRTLCAERDISRVLHDYCEYVDRRDVDAIVSLFTEDATFDYGTGAQRIFIGHDELRQMWTRLDKYQATSHHVSNITIDISALGDSATARSGLYAYHVRCSDQSELHVWGQYRDELILHDGRWLIARRALRAAADKGSVPDALLGGPIYEFLPRR